MLPESRNTAYVAGSQVKSADLDDIQDRIMQLAGIGAYSAIEDFDRYQRTITVFPEYLEKFAFVGDAHAEVRIDNDTAPAAGTYGRAKFLTVDGTASLVGVQSSRLGMGTGTNYEFYGRASVESKSHLETVALVGLAIGVASFSGGYFVAGNDAANWKYVDAGGASHDTGIAVIDGQMVKFRAIRVGGTITAAMNTGSGYSTVYTGADVNDMNAAYPFVGVNGKTWTSHQIYATVDYIVFLVPTR